MLRTSADLSGWCLPDALAQTNRARVFLVDDSEPVRQGLRLLLEDTEITVVGEAANAHDAAQRIPPATQTGPLVALVDVRMPGEHNGIDLTRQLSASEIPVEVIVLTASPEGMEQAAKQAGAFAFLPKAITPDVIVAAVHHAWTAAQQTTLPATYPQTKDSK